ncbi:MAG: hypothetical protein LBJ01_00930, partial [Tannerella sp.]|nr:hypothetical protein [Tannerella sp.]
KSRAFREFPENLRELSENFRELSENLRELSDKIRELSEKIRELPDFTAEPVPVRQKQLQMPDFTFCVFMRKSGNSHVPVTSAPAGFTGRQSFIYSALGGTFFYRYSLCAEMAPAPAQRPFPVLFRRDAAK